MMTLTVLFGLCSSAVISEAVGMMLAAVAAADAAECDAISIGSDSSRLTRQISCGCIVYSLPTLMPVEIQLAGRDGGGVEVKEEFGE